MQNSYAVQLAWAVSNTDCTSVLFLRALVMSDNAVQSSKCVIMCDPQG